MELNFIQSNWLRQYPFRNFNGGFDSYNNKLPTDIIVGLKISCLLSDLDLYINKIVTDNGNIGITFAGNNGPIGYANSVITTNNQNLIIYNFNEGVIGNVTIGNSARIMPKQTFSFNNTNGLIEGSTITIISPPLVTGITIKGTTMTGAITLTSTSLGINTGSELNLSVLYPVNILSRGDLSSTQLSCNNFVISGINTVIPNLNGNIDIYAISPLVISTGVVDGVTQLIITTPGITLSNVCVPINLPPINPSQTSYEPINTIVNPEYSTWPQYS
jgi:hypothetical protein